MNECCWCEKSNGSKPFKNNRKLVTVKSLQSNRSENLVQVKYMPHNVFVVKIASWNMIRNKSYGNNVTDWRRKDIAKQIECCKTSEVE